MGEKCSWSECKVLVRKMLGYSWPILVLVMLAHGILASVAGESNVPFFSISGSEFVEMFVCLSAITSATPLLSCHQVKLGTLGTLPP